MNWLLINYVYFKGWIRRFNYLFIKPDTMFSDWRNAVTVRWQLFLYPEMNVEINEYGRLTF
ncbi:hypothetical protein [Ornithinibacillus bavariensis]|uniref:hypothetical protein n=1 Tax=Ornithinibacillus bavariensis TaxID=545502 RepID=UPI003D216CB3